MKWIRLLLNFLVLVAILAGCRGKTEPADTHPGPKLQVIFDTDTNNELDDQHALAYLLLNGGTFIVKGITVNATFNGGDITKQYEEAVRVMKLCNQFEKIPLLKGANGSFPEISPHLSKESFDGMDAVNFIINTALETNEELVLIAVGKLTNPALALKKEPGIARKMKIVWLGSNYPEPGEYNQENDTASLNFLLRSRVPFEMVTVRYGKPSGTDAVRVTQAEINKKMKGKGPTATQWVTGRHGNSFNTFGDYSVSLFNHIDYHGNPPSRALFDMAAVAIVKNSGWAKFSLVPSPKLVEGNWQEVPVNTRKIGIWENFDKEDILEDFYLTFDKYDLATSR